jgi:hypothetical protein
MSNIYVEGKGPKGPQIRESLAFATTPTAPSRGLAVTYGSDAFHAALAATAGEQCVGLIEEDVISGLPAPIIEFGQAIAQIGANVTALELLAVNASGLLVPAQPGQYVVAIALEANTYVSPGSFACVLVVAALGVLAPGSQVNYITAAGAIPLVTGTYALNGAAALAMTLATPTTAQDGTRLVIVATTAHAHTVTTASDKIENTKDTVTYAAIGDICILEAVNGLWMLQFIGGPTPAALTEV